MNSHKATFPLPRIKKPRARSGTSREIVAETFSGEKQNLFYRAFSRQKCIRNWHVLKI